MTKSKLTGEYAERGEYHRNPDPNWSYYPYYMAKMDFIRRELKSLAVSSSKILDVGCGEGVFVEELRRKGFKAYGIDSNYKSNFVKRGNITKMPYGDGSFDITLCLDVLEHLSFADQEHAIKEIERVLKHRGVALFSIPNMGHWISRLSFLFRGKLMRTARIQKHPGDRPIKEYEGLLRSAGFEVIQKRGLDFQKLPLVKLFPNLCFLVLVVCKKKR